MADKLGKYKSKRDFRATPEPVGDGARSGRGERFVVQEHHARSLHWDLRLERDGVLISWAVPKGIPTDPKRNVLAVHVEDHPLEYIDFAGAIPQLEYRNLREVTRQYPELRALGRELGWRRVVLDGEIVALDEQGRPDFQRLQPRMHLESESAVRRRIADTPVVYMIFDLPYLDGHSTMALAYTERRALLEKLGLEGPNWRTPSYHVGDGQAMLDASKEQGLEGVIAKRLDSRYEPAGRSGAWLKIKNQMRQEFVIGGWLPGKGARSAKIGSLAVGYYDATRDAEQKLLYAGNVGTGFTERTLEDLMKRLEPLRTDPSPFSGRQPPKGTVFPEPRLVAEAQLRGWNRTRN